MTQTRVRQGLLAAALIAATAGAHAQAPVSAGQSTPTLRAGAPTGSATTVRTSHVTVQAAASATSVTPGGKLSLAIEVAPRRGMHVYAPGKHDYQVVRFALDARAWLSAPPLKYPPSEIYHFVPLDERVETYLKPFTLEQDLTVLDTPEARKALAGQKTVSITGTLEYQACDDKICYAPAKVPLAFTIDLAPSGR